MFQRCLVVVLLTVLALSGCASSRSVSSGDVSNGPKVNVEKVAVVSFAVNSYGFFGVKQIPEELVRDNVDTMFKHTETELGKYWKVVPAASFVGNQEYKNLSIGQSKSGMISPIAGEGSLLSFTDNRKEIIKGIMDPQIAQKLCTLLSVDAVMLVYSEWIVNSGKFIPTQKALTKNCFSMYDKAGNKLFFDRKDMEGEGFIGGAFAGTHINDSTIEKWVVAYNKSTDLVLARHK